MRTCGMGMGLLLVGALGCGGSRVDGPSGQLFGQTVQTRGEMKDGNVVEAVMTLPVKALEQASDTPHAGPPTPALVLEFPAEIQQQTYVNHIGLFWEPGGHPPVYQVPHVDLHFFRVAPAEAAAVDCQDTTPPAGSQVPSDYVLPPPNDPNWCVPKMGIHAIAKADLDPGATFSKTMVLGYYKGALIFVEPMVTREALLARQSFELAIPRPAELPVAKRYPTRFIARYQQATDSYDLVLTDFVDAQ